jgi:hypothetical protein
MTSLHLSCDLNTVNSTKSPKLWPESGLSWDHVGTKSKTSWEQVTATNLRGCRNLATEVKSTAKVTARVTAKVTTYPGASKA